MKHYGNYVEPHRQLILDALDYIWKNPEPGYKEWKTHAYLEEAFAKLGYALTLAGDMPGFYTEIDTGCPGPTVAVFGELDSLVNAGHPDADPETGAVHCCGHCAQSAALLGLAAALTEPGVLDGLCGKIRLVAVPAEELIEVEFRTELRNKGTIRYFGGKQEFLYRGLLDGVDLAFMQHTSPGAAAYVDGRWNGCIAKTITYEGVSAHAGGAPHQGVNALYAANLGLNAINALRETFQDDSHIRVHPIITSGGQSVNAIPAAVRLESYVRGKTVEDITTVNHKVNRALAATAAAMGGNVHLTDTPGYMPEVDDRNMMELAGQAMRLFFDEVYVRPDACTTGCTDMGDISCVMPATQFHIPGASGKSHGEDYQIADPDAAAVSAAKVMLAMLALLLKDEAAAAKQVLAEHTPVFASYADYFRTMDDMFLDRQAVTYVENGDVQLSFVKGE